MALNAKVFATRTITAIVFVVVLLGCIFWNYYSFLSLFFLITLISNAEFLKISKQSGTTISGFDFYTSSLLVFSGIYTRQFPMLSNYSILFIIVGIFIPFLRFLMSQNSSWQNLAMNLLGIIYCTIPFSLFIQIPVSTEVTGIIDLAGSYQEQIVFGIFCLIWANDTFAYLGGSLYGKHKLLERVSPGKTWEGTITGIICSIAVGFLLNNLINTNTDINWPLFGLTVSVLGTIGDLVESKMKRVAGIKDSGNILPGHGGALDRFDSLIFVSPFVYALIKILSV